MPVNFFREGVKSFAFGSILLKSAFYSQVLRMSETEFTLLATKLATTEDPLRVGQLIAAAVCAATGSPTADVYLVNRSEGVLLCLTGKHLQEKNLPLGDAGLPGRAIKKGEPVEAEGRLAVPITYAHQEIGVLVVEAGENPEARAAGISGLAGVIGLALANLAARQEMLAQWRFLEVITTLNWLITSGLESREFYDALHHLIKGLIDFDWMKVLVKEDNRLNVLAFMRDGTPVEAKEAEDPSDLILQARLEGGQPEVLEDLTLVPELNEAQSLTAAGLRSLLLVPLLTKRGVIGGLCFYSREKGKYAEKDFPLAQQLAGQLAITIENSLLINEMARKNREIEKSHQRLLTLNTVAEVLTRSLEIELVLQEVLAKVTEVANWDAGAVYLREENESYSLAAQRGLPDDCAAHVAKSLGTRDDAENNPLRLREELVFFDAREIFRRSDLETCTVGGFASGVVVPLKHQDELRGALVLFHRSKMELTEPERSVLEAVGNQIGVAVENARLYQKVKSMAEHDALTGLYNRHKFFAVLDTELKRCKRYNGKCAVLLFDVDHFKDYNDTFGHLAGDECLRKVSALIRQSIRETDTPARYGGEEFVVLVVEADARAAITVAERLRKRLEAAGQKEPLPTVSIGVAVYPDDAQTVQDLLLIADNNLYTAKRLGRNRTVWRGLVQTA